MHLAYIAFGANLPSLAGTPDATLAAALVEISALGRIAARSSLYSTAPVGVVGQPRFVNAVIAIETELAARSLLNELLSIERRFGRDRADSVANGPRTLDLDLLLYGDLILSEAGLEIPHPRLTQRAFVLVPLAEIAPDLRVPPSRRAVAEFLAGCPDADRASVVRIESSHWHTQPDRAP